MQKGSRSDPNNYQPISVLPILGRTLEKLVPAQLYNFCELNAIIPKQQFGFRRHSSCEMALLSATDSWLDALDKGSYVGVLLISLSKAFDTVPHLLLLSELMNIGCTSESSDVIAWFRNYITDRFQRVITHKEITQWLLFPVGSHKDPASVHFSSIFTSENSQRNVFLISFSLPMIGYYFGGS